MTVRGALGRAVRATLGLGLERAQQLLGLVLVFGDGDWSLQRQNKEAELLHFDSLRGEHKLPGQAVLEGWARMGYYTGYSGYYTGY